MSFASARRFIIILLLSAVLLSSNFYIVSSDSMKLYDIKGDYKVFEINKYEGTVSSYGSMARDADQALAQILILVSTNPSGVKENMSLVGVAETEMGKFFVYRGEYMSHEIEVVIGDKGDFRVIVDDGIAAPWFTCSSLVENRSWVFSYFLGEEYSRPIFAGLSGDVAGVELPACECNVSAGGCERVENASPQTMYENPYELYKFEIDGIPIKPYLKIRCTDPEMHDSFTAVYVEGLLPRLYTDRYEIVNVNEEYVNSIIRLLKESGLPVGDGSDVVVQDFHYSIGFNSTLAPTLVLRAGSGMAVVLLYPDGPRLTAVAQLAGAGGGVVGVSAVDWDDVLANVRPLSEDGEGQELSTLVLVPVVVAAVLLAGYKLAKARR